MSLSEVLHTSLQRLKTKENTQIDQRHCPPFIATFGDAIKKVVSSSVETTYRIPFPLGCGKHVETYLAQEKIPSSSGLIFHINQANSLLIALDTTTDQYSAIITSL